MNGMEEKTPCQSEGSHRKRHLLLEAHAFPVILEKRYYWSPGGPFQSKHDEGKRGENTERREEAGRPRHCLMSCSVW